MPSRRSCLLLTSLPRAFLSARCQYRARAYAHVGDGPIAVRSSGIEEDGADFSFAGQFDTFLDVQGLASTIEHVRKCWASAYSERSLRYRHQHGLDIAATEMAVILQRLVPAEKSGVVFTVSSGEFRAQPSSPAVLYALDATTGKELWNSGTAMTSSARGGLSGGGGQVYVGTNDGTLYAFGFPMEH